MNPPESRYTWSIEPGQWRGARPYQEDDYGYVEGEFGADGVTPAVLMVLADGMGGEVGGANASRCVVEAFLRRIGEVEGTPKTRLEECLDTANREVRAQIDTDPGLEGMGSTVLAAVYDGRTVSWLSVGDSPMWLFTGGRLTRLNADHSVAPILDRMAEAGELSREEALRDGRRHMLRSAVTGQEVELVDRGERPCRLGEGDRLLLASDGLDTLAEEEIARCLGAGHGGLKRTADALLVAVKDAARPAQDNVTFLLMAGKGRVSHRPEASSRTNAKARSRARKAFSRKTMAALLLGTGLLVGSAAWLWHEGWLWRERPESGPDPAPALPAGSSAESVSERPQPQPVEPEVRIPETTGASDPPAQSDRTVTETSVPASPPPADPSAEQDRESAVPPAEPPDGQAPESPASVATQPTSPDRHESDRSADEPAEQ